MDCRHRHRSRQKVRLYRITVSLLSPVGCKKSPTGATPHPCLTGGWMSANIAAMPAPSVPVRRFPERLDDLEVTWLRRLTLSCSSPRLPFVLHPDWRPHPAHDVTRDPYTTGVIGQQPGCAD